MKTTALIVFFSSSLAMASGCNLFGKDFDSIEEEGSQAEKLGPGPFEACPENSGYPCACSVGLSYCQDGSRCVFLADGAPKGFCSAKCGGTFDSTSCAARKGYGVKAGCIFSGGSEENNSCAVFCEAEGLTGPCPVGLACKDFGAGSICLPPMGAPVGPDGDVDTDIDTDIDTDTDTDTDTDADTDSDTDADTDSDTDADTDSDTDADTDSDSDSDSDVDRSCPINSGWPCTCTSGSTCGDGSLCIKIDLFFGPNDSDRHVFFCSDSCDTSGFNPCNGTKFDADESCRLGNPVEYCVLECTSSSQCPDGQLCQMIPGIGLNVCYPEIPAK